MSRLGAYALLDLVLDRDSWHSWDHPGVLVPPADPAYAAELARAREASGLAEAVVTGEGVIGGHRVAVVVGEFAFLAGSFGVETSERLVRAIERATRDRLPLLAATSSGGTRMQEGTIAFLRMVSITQAVGAHRAAGLPYLVYLRDPTTGGVFASWGSLGHVAAAEPGALIGFLGPRVYRALYGEPFPPGVQVAENLLARGLVDAVVPAERLGEAVARVLTVTAAVRRRLPVVAAPVLGPVPDLPAWESVERSRRPDRPGVRALLAATARDITRLRGTGSGEQEPGVRLALCRFGSAPAVVLGQDRSRQRSRRPLGPAGLRELRRGMRVAAELGLPIVTVIDTGGASLSPEAEEGGLAGEIARCLADLVTNPAPTVSVLLGEGAGGAALALLPADRVVVAQHAWLAPLPPEGASAIRYRTTERAAQVAQAQGVRSLDLLAHRLADVIVPERPDAADEPEPFLKRLGAVLEHEVTTLLAQDPAERLAARHIRYRTVGLPDGAPALATGTGAGHAG